MQKKMNLNESLVRGAKSRPIGTRNDDPIGTTVAGLLSFDFLDDCVCHLACSAQESVKRESHNTIRMLGVPATLIRHDSRLAQLMEVGVNADKIVQTAKEMLGIAPGRGKACTGYQI